MLHLAQMIMGYKRKGLLDLLVSAILRHWKKISFSLNYKDSDFELFLRFAAKVALGSGYFLYKDYFVENTDHDELRLIMNGLSKLSEEERKNIKTRCYLGRWFSQKRDTEAKEYKLYSEICKSAQGSIVIIYPTKNSLCFHIGVVSEYIGMINVPANCWKNTKIAWDTFL